MQIESIRSVRVYSPTTSTTTTPKESFILHSFSKSLSIRTNPLSEGFDINFDNIDPIEIDNLFESYYNSNSSANQQLEIQALSQINTANLNPDEIDLDNSATIRDGLADSSDLDSREQSHKSITDHQNKQNMEKCVDHSGLTSKKRHKIENSFVDLEGLLQKKENIKTNLKQEKVVDVVSLEDLDASQVELSQTGHDSNNNTADTSGASPKVLFSWILDEHESWSRLTLNEFFISIHDGTVTENDLQKYAKLRMEIMGRFREEMESIRTIEQRMKDNIIACFKYDHENLINLFQDNLPKSFPIPLDDQLCELSKQLHKWSEETGNHFSATWPFLCTLWAFMMSSWQAWNMRKSRLCQPGSSKSVSTSLQQKLETMCNLMTRKDWLWLCLELRNILEKSLDDADEKELSEIKEAFEKFIKRLCAMLYEMEQNGHNACERCGRIGHDQDTCTFKKRAKMI